MTGELDVSELAERVRAGETRALGRAISLVENDPRTARALTKLLFPATGAAHIVALTGPPGAGKSTLISALVTHLRASKLTVGVLMFDPSSPFTRGALLGDRIRLSDHFNDPGVFIRSLGTRDWAGGLSEAALEAVLVLDASGKDVVLVETVGAGQSDVAVRRIADTVVLVLVPGAGDSVQALKAGIMEIPDVIAVNKLDHPAAQATKNDVRGALSLGPEKPPPILLTEATRGDGIPELWTAIASHRAGSEADGTLRERRGANAAAEVLAVASARAGKHLENAVADDSALRALLERVADRSLDPLTAVHELLREVFHIDDQDDPDPR